METVTILRSLWRHRLAVCLVAVVAILIGWSVAYRLSLPPQSRAYSVGIASASILVDTPKSQVVAVDPEGSDTLAARANVLANLMVDGEIKGVIAKRAKLPADKLIASTKTAATADPPPLDASSRVLTTSLAQTSDLSELPIIRVDTQAPDVRQAIELANAAVASLGQYLGSKAVAETIPEARRLRVRALGTAQGHSSMRGPGRVLAIVAALFVFAVGCGLILVASALIRTWRTAAAFDRDFGGFGGPSGGAPGDFGFEAPRAQEPPARPAEAEPGPVDAPRAWTGRAAEPSRSPVGHMNGSAEPSRTPVERVNGFAGHPAEAVEPSETTPRAEQARMETLSERTTEQPRTKRSGRAEAASAAGRTTAR